MKKKPIFPMPVTIGSATVMIYKTPTRGNEGYTVSYWLDGKRKRHGYSELQTAKDRANEFAKKLTSGDLEGLTLSRSTLASYQRAMELLQPSGVSLECAVAEFVSALERLRPTGVTIGNAVAEFVAVFKQLDGASISEAIQFYIARRPKSDARNTVAEGGKEMILSKEADGVRRGYTE